MNIFLVLTLALVFVDGLVEILFVQSLVYDLISYMSGYISAKPSSTTDCDLV